VGATRARFSRRRFLVGGAVGGVVVSVAPTRLAALGLAPNVTHAAAINDALATVTIDTPVGQGTVPVAIGGTVTDVTPQLFPASWTLAAGDVVVIDKDLLEAYPFVTFTESSDGVNFMTVNADPADDRVIATHG
jgi:hypothetical protein